jgi:hypothetical protein
VKRTAAAATSRSSSRRALKRAAVGVALASALSLGTVAATPAPARAIGACFSYFVYQGGIARGATGWCYEGPGSYQIWVYCHSHAGGGRWLAGPIKGAGLLAAPSTRMCGVGAGVAEVALNKYLKFYNT